MILDEIERLYGVNVDVYAYTDDGDRLAFEFGTMNADADDVMVAAQAIDRLKVLSNKRPRVGKVLLP